MDDIIDAECGPAELHEAIHTWGSGEPIPYDLAVTLMGMGYDVEYLERKHRI